MGKKQANGSAEQNNSGHKFVGWLVALRPSNMLVYLRDGSAQTVLRAATLRQKL